MTAGVLPRPIAAVGATARRALRVPAWLRPMRVGVGLDARGVRAVGVAADGSVRWAVEAQLDDGDSLAAALAELLAGAPLGRRWPRPEVRVAVGHGRAQTKRLAGLPAVSDPSLLAPIVAQSVGRFFLKNGLPLVVAGVRAPEEGGEAAWAAAIEAPVVDGVVRACRMARVRLGAVAPTPAIVGLALEGSLHELVDGGVRTEVTTHAGRLTAVRRTLFDATPTTRESVPRPVPALAALGASAAHFADAYGAALLPDGEPLAWRPRRGDVGESTDAAVPRWRLALAASALGLSVLGAALAPGLAAHRAVSVTARELAALAPRAREATAAEHELERLDAALGEVAAFDVGRRSQTEFLRAVTAALPEGSALVTLRVDSASGTVVALGPRAGAIVSAFERMPGVSAPEIVGPVTREAAPSAPAAAAPAAGSARELERVTVRFRFDGRARPDSSRMVATPSTSAEMKL